MSSWGVILVVMGKFYASQQAYEAANDCLERRRYQFEYLGVVNALVKQPHQSSHDHRNDDKAQRHADHQRHIECQLGFHFRAM